MTLQVAIEVLNEITTLHPEPPHDTARQAIKLGIEALKRIDAQNEPRTVSQRWLLPGETKD